MKPIDFPQAFVLIAKDQLQYIPLPAHVADGVVTCCWQLSLRERLSLLFSGKIWHQIHTFRQPLQPQRLDIRQPEMYISHWMKEHRKRDFPEEPS